MKRMLALGAALAMAVFAAPASASPPSQASCQGILISLEATAGSAKYGEVGGFVVEVGGLTYAGYQQLGAHAHGSCG
jgi:hypothetical protein